MTQSIGWWEWAPEDDAMTIASTGERVAYLGPFNLQSELDLPGEHWLLFEYRRDDVRYPVLVQSGSYHPRGRSRATSIYLRLDHIASARLFARQSAMQSKYPPHALWERVDDLMVDAISCWPTDLIDTYWRHPLYVNGGWLNGDWSETYLRRFHYWRGRGFPSDESVVTSNLGPAPDAAPVWQYVHVDSPVNRFDISDETAGDEWPPPRHGWPGLEASMPHLARKSGGAVLFPSRAYVSRQPPLTYPQGGMPDAKGLFRYADPEVSCLFAGCLQWPPGDALFSTNPHAPENRRFLRPPDGEHCSIPQFRKGAPRPWQFSAAVADFGYAHPGSGTERQADRDPLGTTERNGSRSGEFVDWLIPEPGLWRRLRSAILQAWSVWPGRMNALVAEQDAQAVRDYEFHHGKGLLELPLPAASQVCIDGAYVGGRWMAGASVTSTCLPDWRFNWEEPTLLELTSSTGGPARPCAVGVRKISSIE